MTSLIIASAVSPPEIDVAKRVLIISSLADEHAIDMAAYLRSHGVPTDIWYTDLYPSAQTHTIRFGPDGEFSTNGIGAPVSHDGYVSVWVRRPIESKSHVDRVHPDDRDYVGLLAGRYHKSLRQFLRNVHWPLKGGVWVNGFEGIAAAESKPLQLALAIECGLSIPETLISNDRAAIVSFIETFPSGAIQKSMEPYTWSEDTASFFNETANVSASDIPSERITSYTPEIYQRKISKIAEVRTLFIGDEHYSLRMAPTSDLESPDWRILHVPGNGSVEQVTLPDVIVEKCVALMARIGIVTASFDFLIDVDENYIFSELNQAGQFLWMEGYGHPVMTRFATFLAGGILPDVGALSSANIRTHRERILEKETLYREQLGSVAG